MKEHQLNIMLLLCGACGILALLLLMTRFLSPKRKRIIILMEVTAFFLLFFDRLAYIYAGDPGRTAYIMVRVSNFAVFFLTSAIVFGFNLYLTDWMLTEGKMSNAPLRLRIVEIMAILGMVMAVIAAFTGFYYIFDDMNTYHRGRGFLFAYAIPVAGPLIQYTVIRQYKKIFSKYIYISLLLYTFVPILCGIFQIFNYGISIVNMSMVAVSISLYFFTYIDINNTVEHAHEIELENVQDERTRQHRLFDQTATAFVSAVEKKDDFTRGNSVKVAEYARRIAKLSGKDDDFCEEVYYAALLHDVGMIGVPDSVIKNEEDPGKWDYEAMRKKPLIGEEILSSITEFPYLSRSARYSHERYNGTGYPDGLQGDEIPEISRIIGVADAYVTMTTKKRYRDARPVFMAREAFVKGAGEEFDPKFSHIMVKIIDEDSKDAIDEEVRSIEAAFTCNEYRDHISAGISIKNSLKKISFDCVLSKDEHEFSAPSVVLFDSYDRRTHDNKKSIKGYNYQEYGEIWFDEHSILTAARNIEETVLWDDRDIENIDESQHYEIISGRYEDHLKLIMKSPSFEKEVIVALPGKVNYAYIGLTGEHCELMNITVENMAETYNEGDIRRIAKEISYIDHMESDVKNIQIDSVRSASTEGIPVENRLKLFFHTMSLPEADLVWHCPYLLLFYSDNGLVGGPGYEEYSLIKLNGENDGHYVNATNNFIMKKKSDFPGWETWKERNREGLECEVSVVRKKDKIFTRTENLGIFIDCATTVNNKTGKVYLALTGDQIALTDIRVS